MAKVFIKIDTTKPGATHAGLLRALAQQQRAAYELAARVLEIMANNAVTAAPADYVDMEALFGLEVGDGATTFDLVNGLVGALEGNFQNNNGENIGVLIG